MKAKQLIFIRHGEKINYDNDVEPVHLSEDGYKRADMLPNFFIKNRPHGINIPDVLISMKQHKKHTSNRAYETIEPLSKALELPIYDEYLASETNEIVDILIHNYKNKTVLVCWEHKYLVEIVNKIGINVKSWGLKPFKDEHNDCYDAVWVVEDNVLSIYKEFDHSKYDEYKF